MYKRKITTKLEEWKKNDKGKTALLIEGARRVGKTTIIEDFAKNNYESYVIIDFEKNPQYCEIFEIDKDPSRILFEISIIFKIQIIPRKTLIIFDEVHKCPDARTAIKYLIEDGKCDYIETGSLLTLMYKNSDLMIPSEEKSLVMNSMDFEEFLWALGYNDVFNLAKEAYLTLKPLSNIIHEKLMSLLRIYMVVGGMPQAINAYLDTNDYQKVDDIQQVILGLYQKTINKYAGVNASKVAEIFYNIPSQLNKKNKRYILASLSKEPKM
ncbi:MAG: AAA family ATPase, partial [Bacillales bacterium]|nr:AAA family ATPase [Bacillales bacterium]